MPLDARITVEWYAALTKALDLSAPKDELVKRFLKSLSSGVGLDQADKLFHDRRTINAAATDSLDLAGGGLVDAFGDAFTLARLKGLLVVPDPANVNNVNVVRPAANGLPLFLAAGDGIAVPPGGHLSWLAPTAAGIVVTAGTGDLLDLVNGGGGTAVIVDIVLIGGGA